MCLGSECGTVRRTGRSKRDLVRIREARVTFPGACATRLPRGKRSLPGMDRRSPRQHRRSSQAEESTPGRGKAVYFTGRGDQLRLKPGVEVPRGNFTLEMWIKPEGGQRSPAVIAGLYDKCFYASSDRGWLLGIRAVSEQGNRDPRFFFSLKTDRAHKVTSITSNARYLPNQWSHLAVTYDGLYMKLFVNGAQVAVSREQSGEVFSHLTKKCKVLMIGGNALNHNYRGAVEQLTLWSRARTAASPRRRTGGRAGPGEAGYSLDTALEPPPCGQTVCDNVEVITNYNDFWGFRKPKAVRYRVVNVHDDARRKPTVTEHQIHLQHQHLNDAFRAYNITWELSVHNVYNSSLRHRLVLANCDISKVGDEECDPECNHTLTGFDAGYCKKLKTHCPESRQGNGVCDPECNWDNYYYDKGDCCNPNITDVTKTCFNPSSPLRGDYGSGPGFRRHYFAGVAGAASESAFQEGSRSVSVLEGASDCHPVGELSIRVQPPLKATVSPTGAHAIVSLLRDCTFSQRMKKSACFDTLWAQIRFAGRCHRESDVPFLLPQMGAVSWLADVASKRESEVGGVLEGGAKGQGYDWGTSGPPSFACASRPEDERKRVQLTTATSVIVIKRSTLSMGFIRHCDCVRPAGVATWPWDKEALTHLGGIVLNPSFYGTFGHTHTMVHEIGHSLGLYHVFRGISEIESCNDACLETEPSLETGDLCADTNPTPKYKHCRDPEPGNDTCGHRRFTQTPFNNYMSYADDDCNGFLHAQPGSTDALLPGSDLPVLAAQQQAAARSHGTPGGGAGAGRPRRLEWFPSITGHFYDREVGSVCDRCTEGRVLLQYASNSSSPRPCAPSGYWSPREAEGPPDVEQVCEPSVRTWSPNAGVDSSSVGSPPCPLQGCMLQLEFPYPLVPDSLTVWVTFFSPEETALPAIHNILLLTVGGENVSLGPRNVFCDTPLTLKLDVREEVYGVQFFTTEQHLEIDATLLTSKPDCPLCRPCQPLRYRLVRQPAFSHAPHGLLLSDPSRRYVDRVVEFTTMARTPDGVPTPSSPKTSGIQLPHRAAPIKRQRQEPVVCRPLGGCHGVT
ncbi:hypothetical protein SKAU_G00005480 [Synaphobranchus kaupii]|uniref:Uncharacterized protein n=1 Tax=Synaphobranchus kaupii TaxID=118154 RepID=A0A9Q1JCF5_SYNKA|nr:hypothetical protein SKAU_G00005480 [Synaphobranchus kaupii]